MQNLRDKLLKAGLVTEKQAKEADRKGTKPQGTVKQKQQSVSEEERQRREAFALRAAELAEERRKEAAKKAEARQQSERALRLRQLVEANRVREPPGEVNFHFVKRSGSTRWTSRRCGSGSVRRSRSVSSWISRRRIRRRYAFHSAERCGLRSGC